MPHDGRTRTRQRTELGELIDQVAAIVFPDWRPGGQRAMLAGTMGIGHATLHRYTVDSPAPAWLYYALIGLLDVSAAREHAKRRNAARKQPRGGSVNPPDTYLDTATRRIREMLELRAASTELHEQALRTARPRGSVPERTSGRR